MTNKKLAQELKALGDLLVIAGQDEAKAGALRPPCLYRFALVGGSGNALRRRAPLRYSRRRPRDGGAHQRTFNDGNLPDASRLGAARPGLRPGIIDYSRHWRKNGAASVSGLRHCQHCGAGAGRSARRHHGPRLPRRFHAADLFSSIMRVGIPGKRFP